MTTVNEFEPRISEVGVKPLLEPARTSPEAKAKLARLRIAQTELGLIKRDINAEITALRQAASAAADKLLAADLVIALFAGKPRPRSSQQTLHKRRAEAKLRLDILPYEALKRTIDGTLLAIDKAVLELEEFMDVTTS